jgi:magnesium chelatase subunit I
MTTLPTTRGALRASGWRDRTVKAELRHNAIERLRAGRALFPGIVGFEDTVEPALERALLAGHDIVLLGERGQAKTRIIRSLVGLLDPEVPAMAGCEINDSPLDPSCARCRALVDDEGDDAAVAWIDRERRYGEKLATPDTAVADLIGDVDPIRVAEGRYMSDELVIHYGLVPRTNRGIFSINELPDLPARIQVALFNVLEERDVQIRGFTVRLPLDLCMVFSANPEDYTNRGRIVTPLKDRIGSVIRTHYPLSREIGVRITDENAWSQRDGDTSVAVPAFMKEIVEETSRLARSSPHVNQSSGVSVRMSIANFENMLSNAERRAILLAEQHPVARISDLAFLAASSRGKMELNMTEEPGEEDKLVTRLIEEAVKNVFDQHFNPKHFHNVVEYFESGNTLEVGDKVPTSELLKRLEKLRDFCKQTEKVVGDLEPELSAGPFAPQLQASVAEFILEGLYAHNRLNKKRKTGAATYGL